MYLDTGEWNNGHKKNILKKVTLIPLHKKTYKVPACNSGLYSTSLSGGGIFKKLSTSSLKNQIHN